MRLTNPISDDTTMMRPHLLMGLLHNVSSNLRRFQEDIRLFETGKAFGKSLEAGHFEEPRIGYALYGKRLPESWSGGPAGIDFYDAKATASSLLDFLGTKSVHYVPTVSKPFLAQGKAAEILMDGDTVGWVGAVRRELASALEISGTVYYGEIRLEAVSRDIRPAAQFKALPKFPPVVRDFACVLSDQVPVGDVLAMVSGLSSEPAPHISEQNAPRSLETHLTYRRRVVLPPHYPAALVSHNLRSDSAPAGIASQNPYIRVKRRIQCNPLLSGIRPMLLHTSKPGGY